MSSTTLVVFVIPVTLLVLNMLFFFVGLYIKRKEAREEEVARQLVGDEVGEANLAIESPKAVSK